MVHTDEGNVRPVVKSNKKRQLSTAADLGMFSMFGRTGPPTINGAPTRGAAIFATQQHAGNSGRHQSERVKWIKASKATVMTKKVASFSGENK